MTRIICSNVLFFADSFKHSKQICIDLEKIKNRRINSIKDIKSRQFILSLIVTIVSNIHILLSKTY